MIAAMERRVDSALVFVLFASRASAKSDWVAFELDRSRLASIQRKGFRLLVFPVDDAVKHSDLPTWVQEHWIDRAGHSPRDVARYIRHVVEAIALSELKSSQVLGRGALLDQMYIDFQEASITNPNTPNVLFFGGYDGIGRRTVAGEFLLKAYPALKNLRAGPVFELPQFADLADIFRSLRQEIEPHFSYVSFQADLEAFRALSADEQITEIILSLEHFSDLDQAVTLITGNGIFEDRGFLKSWVPGLFRAIAAKHDLKLCVISNRIIHDNELRAFSNVVQFSVPALTDVHIRSIMIAAAEDRQKK